MNQLPPSLDYIQKACPSLSRVVVQAARAAATEVPILILGEPGSGRTALARGVHAAGRRAEQPLIEVDPGALPATLFESELFGYQAGAFTGAERSHRGRVARAEGGTLLLDHVAEIPLAVQPKLLRLLAEGRYAPLGGAERTADLRFLAVGSADLPARVKRGAFRSDLYFRLEVMTLVLEPLRRRREDLEPLIDHLLADVAERSGRKSLRLSDAARRWMANYPWPGNLRELKNVLERAALLAESDRLDPQPLGEQGERPRSLAEVEREQIVKALAYTRGHQGRAAEILGISRKALWEKRRRYGLP